VLNTELLVFYLFKCILNFGCMFCLGIGSILFSNITFQINLIISVFDCLFSVVFFEVIGWVFKRIALEIPHTSWTMDDMFISCLTFVFKSHQI